MRDTAGIADWQKARDGARCAIAPSHARRVRAPFVALLLALVPMAPLTAANRPETSSAFSSARAEAKPFSPGADSKAAIESALTQAALDHRLVLAVLGSNWCHDSTALAGWLETPRFKILTSAAFVVVYVDVAVPQTGNGINQDIAKRFGLKKMRHTPALLVIGADAMRRNSRNDAVGWRNAASRSEDAVFAALERYAQEFGGA